jgi:hypothetical protein
MHVDAQPGCIDLLAICLGGFRSHWWSRARVGLSVLACPDASPIRTCLWCSTVQTEFTPEKCGEDELLARARRNIARSTIASVQPRKNQRNQSRKLRFTGWKRVVLGTYFRERHQPSWLSCTQLPTTTRDWVSDIKIAQPGILP